MNILLVGDGHAEIHEPACSRALRELGHRVTNFLWYPYFREGAGIGRDNMLSISRRLQNRFLVGSAVSRLNRDLLAVVRREQPEMVLVYRGTHVRPATLQAVRESLARPAVLVSLNNDDPFSPDADAMLWRHFKRCIPLYDVNFVYRRSNIEEYLAAGGRNVHLLRSYFIPWRNYPSSIDVPTPLAGDVVFAGHYEADGRLAVLEAIAAAGLDLRIYGPEWETVIRSSRVLRHLAPIRYLDGELYNRVIGESKISLCFLSRLNRDTYTRRCFEIPAAGGFMLSEYSAELAELFEEGSEAEFFRSREELLDKIRRYLGDSKLRVAVAARGRERVIKDRHDVVSRMAEAINFVEGVSRQPVRSTQ